MHVVLEPVKNIIGNGGNGVTNLFHYYPGWGKEPIQYDDTSQGALVLLGAKPLALVPSTT